MRPALFLDRDGVIVKDVDCLIDPRNLALFDGAAAAITRARVSGLAVVVVTNQPVVARGLADEDAVRAAHAELQRMLGAHGANVDAFYFCPHHPSATIERYRLACACRKPRPGMLHTAARELDLDLRASMMVGDRLSDVAAGARAGCRRTVLVETGKHLDPGDRVARRRRRRDAVVRRAGFRRRGRLAPRRRALKAVVLCAGMGTRLGALTAALPKAMLRVGDEPLLGHLLRHLAQHGIREVAVNLHFRPDTIRAHFGDGAPWGVDLHYADEDVLLGTAGTVRALAPFFADEREVLVVYGDLLLDTDLGELARAHRERKADATLLLHERPGSNSLVQLAPDGRITAFVERPTDEERRANPHPWVNSGVAIVSPALRACIPPTAPADLPRDVYGPGVETLRLFGVPLSGFRCAIDSPERLQQAADALRDGTYDPRKPVTRVV